MKKLQFQCYYCLITLLCVLLLFIISAEKYSKFGGMIDRAIVSVVVVGIGIDCIVF